MGADRMRIKCKTNCQYKTNTVPGSGMTEQRQVTRIYSQNKNIKEEEMG